MPSLAVLYDPESGNWLRFGNLVIEKNGKLITPDVTCGLLQGTYRCDLLRRGVIREEVISREELSKSARIYLVNAVRKWRRAELLPD